MAGNALKIFVGRAALAVKRACAMIKCHGEADTFSKKCQSSKGSTH